MAKILQSRDQIIVLFFVFLSFALLTTMIVSAYLNGEVLSITEFRDITVTSDAPHIISVQIQPESRIPPIANNNLPIAIEIRPANSLYPIVTIAATADASGIASLPDISSNIVPVGTYDVSIKGQSHLRQVFEDQLFDGPVLRSYLLNSPLLKAGDAHPSADNYVNGSDISYLTVMLYSTDGRADLTHDGIVNSLDYAALLKNLYAYGQD